jgi:hypothetical protein
MLSLLEGKMSISLGVKIVKPNVSISEVMEALDVQFRRIFSDAVSISFVLPSNEDGECRLNAGMPVVTISAEPDGKVQLIITDVGADPEYPDQGGCWVGIDVALRSPQSKFLMLLVAVVIARLTESQIWDDDGWTGQSGWTTAEATLARMPSHSSLGFEQESELRFPSGADP